jgi:hypothetical protein
MRPLLQKIYTDEVYRQASTALHAYDRMQDLLRRGAHNLQLLPHEDWWVTEFFDAAQTFLTHADIVSALLYNDKKDRKARAADLRELLDLPDRALTGVSRVRGAFVHIDETIDAWARRNPTADGYHERYIAMGGEPAKPSYPDPSLRAYHGPSDTLTMLNLNAKPAEIAADLRIIVEAVRTFRSRPLSALP